MPNAPGKRSRNGSASPGWRGGGGSPDREMRKALVGREYRWSGARARLAASPAGDETAYVSFTSGT